MIEQHKSGQVSHAALRWSHLNPQPVVVLASQFRRSADYNVMTRNRQTGSRSTGLAIALSIRLVKNLRGTGGRAFLSIVLDGLSNLDAGSSVAF